MAYLPQQCGVGRGPALEDLWLAGSSTPGCDEATDMGHAGSVREQWKMVESVDPCQRKRRASYRSEGKGRKEKDRQTPRARLPRLHKWRRCSLLLPPFPSLTEFSKPHLLSLRKNLGSGIIAFASSSCRLPQVDLGIFQISILRQGLPTDQSKGWHAHHATRTSKARSQPLSL